MHYKFLLATTASSPHLQGTLLPRGFFLGLGAIYMLALAVDRLAANLRLPGAAAILLLGLVIPSDWLTQSQWLDAVHVETLHRVSLALLIFYAGLKTDLRRIRGQASTGLALGCGGVALTVAITALTLLMLTPLLAPGLPPAVAVLAMTCLGATDSGAIDDLFVALAHPIRARLTHLLQFEVAVSTIVTLLGFGFLAGLLKDQSHGDHHAVQGLLAIGAMDQFGAVGLHVVAGLLAGLLVGALAPRFIDAIVRSEPMLLLVAVALAFVSYGLGQILGGGGLVAVFVAGVMLSNGRYRINRFEQQALGRVMHPFNTAAEITVLLLLGFLVRPEAIVSVLPLGFLLAIVVPIARLLTLTVLLPSKVFSWPDRFVVAGFGLRAAVPLAMALSLTEELPHISGVTATIANQLGEQILAMLYIVVLLDLLLQPLLIRMGLRSGLKLDATSSQL
ncbi:cation:proton antiporter [Synechococcus sp. CBW1002]|uniref:cation:proton antiporter domain-containing protein n=1 Tax=Synechococcus sp. CBW1002 TaxID=1353134 RepID=UPI001E5C064C|nr:cation:proton antiporter [Synechococcus sp. CBW1002]